jgi:hypothetical protein
MYIWSKPSGGEEEETVAEEVWTYTAIDKITKFLMILSSTEMQDQILYPHQH